IAEILQVAEGDALQPVTGGAGFAVDLEAALQLALVVGSERPGEGPALLDRLLERIVRRAALFRRLGGTCRAERDARCRQCLEESVHGRCSCLHRIDQLVTSVEAAGRGAAADLFFSSTASVIEFGRRRGFSTSPSTGMAMRKKPK